MKGKTEKSKRLLGHLELGCKHTHTHTHTHTLTHAYTCATSLGEKEKVGEKTSLGRKRERGQKDGVFYGIQRKA